MAYISIKPVTVSILPLLVKTPYMELCNGNLQIFFHLSE